MYTAAAQATDPENGLRSLVKALLLSPNFLFRSELGTSDRPRTDALTDFELASALSYLLWDTTPDDTLLDLAAAGKLRDRDRPARPGGTAAAVPDSRRPRASPASSASG